MDPAIIIFGFGIGLLVGLTGMGGASLMTPLLILVFEILQRTYGDELDRLVLGMLGGALLVMGVATLVRSIFFKDVIAERYAVHLYRRHIIAAVLTGMVTGFVIGLTSAGSGTLIAIALIAIFRLTPKRVVGTDIFHAAILLWAAGLAHWVGGNVDFALAGNILLGSVPGVVVGAHFATRAPTGFLRTALGTVLVASGIVTVQKGDPVVWPIAALVAGIGLMLLIWAPRWYAKRRAAELDEEQRRLADRRGQPHDRSSDLTPEAVG